MAESATPSQPTPPATGVPAAGSGSPQAQPGANGAAPARPAPMQAGWNQPVADAKVLTAPPSEGGIAKPPEPAKEPERIDSQRFAALARREQKIRREQQEAKRLHDSVRKEMAELQELRELKRLRDSAAQDPLAYLKAGNVTYEQLVARMLQGEPPPANTPPEVVQQVIEQVVDQRIEAQSRAVEQKQSEEVISTAHEKIVELVKANAEKYEYTNLYNAQAEVPDLMMRKWRYDKEQNPNVQPTLMSWEEAAEQVEKYYEGEVQKGTKAKKYQSSLQPAVPGPEAGTGKANGTSAAPHTLTNDMTISLSGSVPRNTSDEQRIANALAVAKRLAQK